MPRRWRRPSPLGDDRAPPAAPMAPAHAAAACLPRPPLQLLSFGSLSPLLLCPHSHLPPFPSAPHSGKLLGKPIHPPPTKTLRVAPLWEPPPLHPPKKLRPQESAPSFLDLPDAAPGGCSTKCLERSKRPGVRSPRHMAPRPLQKRLNGCPWKHYQLGAAAASSMAES
jgi:hypothetical protein